jgi:hypothetical protein
VLFSITVTEYHSIPVREKFVPDVIALLAKLEEGGGGNSRSEGEAALDQALVERMYIESQPRHRALLDFLAKHPDHWFYTTDLARELKLENGTRAVAGLFGAFGRRSKHRYDGEKPWRMYWDSSREEAKYTVEPDVASWIQLAARLEGN